MNELQIFNNNEFGDVRTTTISGEPWFVAADVCKALEINNPSQALTRLDDDEKHTTLISNEGAASGKSSMAFVSESGLYSLVLGSRKPEAHAFKRWITHDVIPVIRKTGGYVANADMFIDTYLPNADEATRTLFRTTLETVRRLNAKIEQDKPKVLFADSVTTAKTSILVGELAKIIKQNGFDIGQNRLFKQLREDGFLIARNGSDKNMPTQRAMDMGLFEIVERTINRPDGSNMISKTTKVTGKGQIYFVNRFIGSKSNGTSASNDVVSASA